MLSFKEKVKTVVRFIEPKEIVLFVGSGASTDAYLDDWKTLEEELKTALNDNNILTHGLNAYKLADKAKENIPTIYSEILWEAFRNPFREPGELHEHLASLSPYFKFIVTSNYDKLLETSFRTIRHGIDPPITTNLRCPRSRRCFAAR